MSNEVFELDARWHCRSATVPGYNESVPMTAFGQAAIWSSGSSTWATSGADFIPVDLGWGTWGDGNHLAVANLKNSRLTIFQVNAGATDADDVAQLFDAGITPPNPPTSFGRLRSVVVGPGNVLYVTTSNGNNDRILQIVPS